MKKFVALFAFLLVGLPAVSQAQTYDKAHQIKAAEIRGFIWPKLTRETAISNSQVMALQYLLRNRGFYRSKVDGKFGDATEEAVRNFQRAKGLKVDGIIGPQTWTPLILRLRKGDRGDAVRAVQILLAVGINLDSEEPLNLKDVDGIFGAVTQQQVRDLQKGAGPETLKPDGIVGAHTWSALLAY